MDGGRIPLPPKLSAERSIEVGWLRAESGRVGARFGRSTPGPVRPYLSRHIRADAANAYILHHTGESSFLH